MVSQEKLPSVATEEMLRRKIGQILGFMIPHDLDLQTLKTMIQDEQIAAQIELAISEASQLKDEEAFYSYLSKDVSAELKKTGCHGTIYAVDPFAPEMNQVERIYHERDQRIERGEPIGIILTEEEHKKHQKEGTLPTYQRIETSYVPVFEPFTNTPMKGDNILMQDPGTTQKSNLKSLRKRGSNAEGGEHEIITAEETTFVVR